MSQLESWQMRDVIKVAFAAARGHRAAPLATRKRLDGFQAAGQKRLRFGILRAAEYCVRRALLGDDAVGPKDDLVGYVAGEFHLVRDDALSSPSARSRSMARRISS